jgi:hypothetical protein
MPPGTGPQPLPDVAGFDPASYMSPMDLYDFIFWGKQPNGRPVGNGDATLTSLPRVARPVQHRPGLDEL